MTNPSETRDSELVAGLGLHDDSEPTLAGLTRIVRDGYLPDDYRSSARAAYDKLREAADTIDRLTSTGAERVVEWELEQRAFDAANHSDVPEWAQKTVADLWRQYCLATEANQGETKP